MSTNSSNNNTEATKLAAKAVQLVELAISNLDASQRQELTLVFTSEYARILRHAEPACAHCGSPSIREYETPQERGIFCLACGAREDTAAQSVDVKAIELRPLTVRRRKTLISAREIIHDLRLDVAMAGPQVEEEYVRDDDGDRRTGWSLLSGAANLIDRQIAEVSNG